MTCHASPRLPAFLLVIWMGAAALAAADAGAREDVATTTVLSLDGEDWWLAPDPGNVGREGGWPLQRRPEAKRTKVPWIIQDAFPGYHGVAWYWKAFVPPGNTHPRGRTLLRFWAVDYMAEVWLNGTRVGEHEGGESPFLLDVTEAIAPDEPNLLAVRVLNPTHERIDGIVLDETPHRNKALPYRAGSAWNQGGIMDSVELVLAPAVRVADVFARPDGRTGKIRVRALVDNAGPGSAAGRMEFGVAPAAGGATLASHRMTRELPPGDTVIETELRIRDPRLWDLNDPFLYRVTVRVASDDPASFHERSVRCGFRDFRFRDGYFRLNGRRIYLRCSHTGNCCPVGLELPHDPDLLRRDLLNVKAMRCNAIRFIAGVAKRYQLDLCDEIGLLVYEESYASWCLADSPEMARRYDASLLGMIRRDRNHPSVVIWGLLNETPDGPVFRHAAGLLPEIRALDDSRMVFLNSGRWDRPGGGIAGLEVWRDPSRIDPNVTHNGTAHAIRALGITWTPGQLAFHPGPAGEYSAVRFTARAAGEVEVEALFTSIAERATTDVHVLHGARSLFDGFIHLQGGPGRAAFGRKLSVEVGDTIDCVVGFGNGFYGADSTGLAFRITGADGTVHDAAADFSVESNPNGVWSYGRLAPGGTPDAKTFTPYADGIREKDTGTLSNPGSAVWEDVLSDRHPYQRVPHTAAVIRTLRTLEGNGRPVFVSEYGVGSAVDLVRVVRLYEQLGKEAAEDARFYRTQRDRFLADWERWHLSDTFDRPEDYFAACLAKMAGLRRIGLNAIRSNPHCVGYSLTGTVDQGMTGEGLATTFREPKPGTFEAIFDGFAPLRWCLFAEPVHVVRKATVRLEAVLANEDVLRPGEYPVRLEVVGPGAFRVFRRTLTVRIPERGRGPEPPMVLPVFSQDVVIDGPRGKYRFLAAFERGAAAADGAAAFYVDDPAAMPSVEGEVVLWGDDAGLGEWLSARGIRTRPFSPRPPAHREAILVGRRPAPPGGAAAFRELLRRIARGACTVFLCPEVFRKGDDAVGWLPLKRKGSLAAMRSWVYLKDEWAKRHPIFDGLPAGGLMDLTFYRELIPDLVWANQEPPAEAVAGAINASQAYSSGLLVAVHRLGAGRFILNTLAIRENLGAHPAAERLLRNMLRYAALATKEPLAEPPPDFEAQLEAMGTIE